MQKLFVRLFENRPTLHIASVTPIALAEFLDELNQERTEIINKVLQNATEVSRDHEQSQENHAKEVKKAYKDVQALIERKWSAAIYEFCLGKTHPEKVDQIKVNPFFHIRVPYLVKNIHKKFDYTTSSQMKF